MNYPHSWITESGHRATVSNPERDKYTFKGISKDGQSFEFDFYHGATSKSEKSGEFTQLEHEVYIEWCQLSQMI